MIQIRMDRMVATHIFFSEFSPLPTLGEMIRFQFDSPQWLGEKTHRLSGRFARTKSWMSHLHHLRRCNHNGGEFCVMADGSCFWHEQRMHVFSVRSFPGVTGEGIFLKLLVEKNYCHQIFWGWRSWISMQNYSGIGSKKGKFLEKVTILTTGNSKAARKFPGISPKRCRILR